MKSSRPNILTFISSLLGSIIAFIVIVATVVSMGFEPVGNWFFKEPKAQAITHWEQGEYSDCLWCLFKGLDFGSTTVLIVLFLVLLFSLHWLVGRVNDSRKKPDDIPQPKRKAGAVPFKKIRIGTLQEFVGRGDEMDWLKQKLIEEPALQVVITSLHGAGGMGKTFLAQKFASVYGKEIEFTVLISGLD